MNQSTQSIRVLQIISSYYPMIGGAERATGTLSKGLNQQGHVSCILTRWYPDLARYEEIDGVPVHRFGIQGPFKLSAISFALHCIIWILFNGRSYPIMHTQNLDTPLFIAVIVRLLTGKEWVTTIHGEWHLPARSKTALGRLRLSILFRLAKGYVSISEANKAAMHKVGINLDQIVSIPNSIDAEGMRPATDEERLALRQQMNYDKDDIIILYLARLIYRKRPDLLITAFSRLEQSGVRCIMAGDGVERKNLEALVRQHNLEDTFEVIGPIHNVRDYFWLSDIYVLPSQYEGLPVALLESMACGKSILVSRCEGNLQAIEEDKTGLAFDIDDEDGLVEQLNRLIEDPTLRKTLAHNAREVILEQYSMEFVAQQHANLYKRVLQPEYAAQTN